MTLAFQVLRIVFHELDVPVQELVKIEHQRTAGEIRWKILYLNLLHGELCEGQVRQLSQGGCVC